SSSAADIIAFSLSTGVDSFILFYLSGGSYRLTEVLVLVTASAFTATEPLGASTVRGSSADSFAASRRAADCACSDLVALRSTVSKRLVLIKPSLAATFSAFLRSIR